MYVKWIECIKSIHDTGKSGKCPKCKSENTDYAYVLVDKANNMGYLDVWCNDCKSIEHISRVKIDDTLKQVINVDDVDSVIPKYKVI